MIYLIGLLVCCCAGQLYAQQETIHGQVFNNHFWQNPAAAGAEGMHKIRMNYRMQWAQLTGSPHTATLSYNALLNRVGIGAIVQYDRIASFQRVSASMAYAYHVPLKKDFKLSVGLNLKYFNVRLSNTDDLGLANNSDIAVVQGQMGSNAFDAGAGLYLYHPRFFVGLSAINLIEWRLNFGQSGRDSQAKLFRQYQAMAGYHFNLESCIITPSLYFRMVQAAAPQVDINVKVALMEEQIFAGLGYRTTQDFLLFIAFKINKLVHLGYSYEFSASNLQTFHAGTHEVTLGIDLFSEVKSATKNNK